MHNGKFGGEGTYEEAHGDSKENSEAIYSEEDEKRSRGRLEVAHPKAVQHLLDPWVRLDKGKRREANQ